MLYLLFRFFQNIHELVSIQYEKFIKRFIIFFFGCFGLLVEEFGINGEKFLDERWSVSDGLERIIYGFECLSWTCTFFSIFFLIIGTFFVAFLVIGSRFVEVFVSYKYFLCLHLKNIINCLGFFILLAKILAFFILIWPETPI